MDLRLEIEFSKTDLIKDVDALKKQVDALRPLPPDVEGKVMQKLRLDWNYNSNAIEGNKLTYGETVALLMEGITASGKPLKDSLDIRGHDKAIDFLLSITKEPRLVSETDIRALHEMVLVEPYTVKAITPDGLPTSKTIILGAYKVLPNHVETATGKIHYYATPEETPIKMRELLEWYIKTEESSVVHPIVIAALFHHKFVAIHPFDDGNGRLSRILMNLILMRHGYPPSVVKMDDKRNYYALLSRADNNDSWPFVEYIAELAKSSLKLYLKAANGGDIDEDIDKKIALFKMELESKAFSKDISTERKIIESIENDLFQLFKKLATKSSAFDEYFLKTTKYFNIDYENDELEILNKKFFLDENFQSFNNIKNIRSISNGHFRFTFDGFKKNKGFDITIYWNIFFSKDRYLIYHLNQEVLLSKAYNEKISLTEQKTLINTFIDELKFAIEKL